MNLLRGPLLLSLLGATALTACSSKLVPGDGSNPERAFPVVCAWAHTTSDTSCPAGACPIVLDEELTCDDDRFGEYSVSVAPTPDATWLATSAPGEHMVYRLSGGKNERQEGIPDAFNGNRISLALGPDGAPQLIADPVIRSSKDPGNVTRAVFANGKWTSSVIIDTTESPRRVIDFAITPSGEPFLWFTGGPSETVELATSKGQGTWTLDPKVAPFDRYTLDADVEFSTPAGPEQMGCSGSVVDDMSTGTVHLVRIAPDGSAPTEVLSMPIGRLLNIDVRGSGKELAIGMATVGFTGMNTVRVLRIDTTKL